MKAILLRLPKAITRIRLPSTPSFRKWMTFAGTVAACSYFFAPIGPAPWTLPLFVVPPDWEQFNRPTDQEREESLRMDLDGLNIKDDVIRELVKQTGPRDGRPGFTFSDMRAKLLPDAPCHAFPARAMTADDLIQAAKEVRPSPAVKDI